MRRSGVEITPERTFEARRDDDPWIQPHCRGCSITHQRRSARWSRRSARETDWRPTGRLRAYRPVPFRGSSSRAPMEWRSRHRAPPMCCATARAYRGKHPTDARARRFGNLPVTDHRLPAPAPHRALEVEVTATGWRLRVGRPARCFRVDGRERARFAEARGASGLLRTGSGSRFEGLAGASAEAEVRFDKLAGAGRLGRAFESGSTSFCPTRMIWLRSRSLAAHKAATVVPWWCAMRMRESPGRTR